MSLCPLNLSSFVGAAAVVQAVQEGDISPLCGRAETLNWTDFVMFGGMITAVIAAASAFFMGYTALGVGVSVLLLPLAVGLFAVRQWADLHSLEEVSSDLRLTNDMLRTTQQALSVNVEEFHQENVQLRETRNALNQENVQLRETRNALNQEVSQLGQENRVLRKTSETLTQKVKELGEENSRYEKANHEHETKIREFERSNTDYKTYNEELSEKLKTLESTKTQLATEVENLSRVVNKEGKKYLEKINNTLNQMKLENDRQAENNRVQEKTNEEMKKQTEDLQRAASDAKESLEAYDELSRNLLALSATEGLPPQMRKVILEFALRFNRIQETLKVKVEGEVTKT